MYRIVNGCIMFNKEYKFFEEAEEQHMNFPKERIEGTLYIVEVKAVRG